MPFSSTEFPEITQNNGNYAVQGHSRSVTDFRTNRKLICDFLLVINTNLLPILHRFRDIAFDRSKFAISLPLLRLIPQWRGSVYRVIVTYR